GPEDEQHDRQDDDPMHQTERTHDRDPVRWRPPATRQAIACDGAFYRGKSQEKTRRSRERAGPSGRQLGKHRMRSTGATRWVRAQRPLAGRTAFVTGASPGSGAAIARASAAAGADVGATGRNAVAVEEVVPEIREAGGPAMPLIGDVAVEADVTAMVAAFV